MSNSEIAEALFVTEATVKTHVAHILTKLALRDRVQAIVAAYEHGLVQPGSISGSSDRHSARQEFREPVEAAREALHGSDNEEASRAQPPTGLLADRRVPMCLLDPGVARGHDGGVGEELATLKDSPRTHPTSAAPRDRPER
jgi:hypothetical protein